MTKKRHWFIVVATDYLWHGPKLLARLKCESKVKTTKESGVGAPSLACNTFDVATPLWPSVRMKLTLPKLGTWSPPELPNVWSSTVRCETPRLGVFLVSLERSWSVDVQNGLALAIWTFVAQVMGKRRAGSQTGSLTPDHWKSGIDLFPTSELKVPHGVEKISTRATTLVQTSLQLDSIVGSYEFPKS
jgi:hypothetical protein